MTRTDYNANHSSARLKIFDISGINVILFTFLDFSFVVFCVVDLAFIHTRSGLPNRHEHVSTQCAFSTSTSILWEDRHVTVWQIPFFNNSGIYTNDLPNSSPLV
jgi:hypothetical protein